MLKWWRQLKPLLEEYWFDAPEEAERQANALLEGGEHPGAKHLVADVYVRPRQGCQQNNLASEDLPEEIPDLVAEILVKAIDNANGVNSALAF